GWQGGWRERLRRLIQLPLAVGAVERLLHRQQITVVFTTGGYIAAPAILAARLAGLPVLLHESNAVAGRVTRLLGGCCSGVALGWSSTRLGHPPARIWHTGTPVRSRFYHPAPLPEWAPRGAGPLLVVMGGSQGARGLNHMVRQQARPWLEAGCRLVHLCGRNDPEMGSLRHPAYVERQFTEEIAGLLQHGDLAISRAGAGSISELAASRCPTVLVPYPHASDQHQEANAAAVAAFGAAVIVHENPDGGPLGRAIRLLLGSRLSIGAPAPDPLVAMADAMGGLARNNAAADMAKVLETLCRTQAGRQQATTRRHIDSHG
ncbi:MAG: UDP-N-acetylglucosamine--N-acetylmuramyl-(pentapeptide) pyrophosphoryl-undecaprenol N-acetylglucosamine transferase, partial [Synechococcus sp. SB0672_bin_6]|nr:UDP-N-acetylglucosamine--N-acetylmuramyl-(pentapeptide) pyrophosphoryl-undecaprenol N-acetylglucosamine transferase [Synechococcus sp. SB0672_bin_6]